MQTTHQQGELKGQIGICTETSHKSVKVWREKGSAHDPRRTSSLVKHNGGSIMAWACVAAGIGYLAFIDDVTHERSSRMKSEILQKHSVC